MVVGNIMAGCAEGNCGHVTATSSEVRRPRLFDVFITHLFPLLDPETIYLLSACSRKLWIIRSMYLSLPVQESLKCICWSIYNCPRTCVGFLAESVPRHYPGCSSKGQSCKALYHDCMKATHCTSIKCKCLECVKAFRKQTVPRNLPTYVTKCVCVICSDKRTKWLASPEGL